VEARQGAWYLVHRYHKKELTPQNRFETLAVMQLDNALLIKAEFSATGATIHKINNALCVYKASYYLGLHNGWTVKRMTRFREAERALRQIIANGCQYLFN
jgi:hypothetical protein